MDTFNEEFIVLSKMGCGLNTSAPKKKKKKRVPTSYFYSLITSETQL